MLEKIKECKVKWNLADLALIFLAELSFILLISFLFLEEIKENPYLGAFFSSIFTLLLVLILLIRRSESWSSLGLAAQNSGKLICIGFLVGIILFVVAKLTFNFTSYNELFSIAITPFKIAQCFIILISFKGFVDILLVPFTEEVFSRGLLFQALSNRFNFVISIIVVSAFDSLIHITSFQNFRWLAIRFFYFIFITYLFKRYHNLLLCFAIHAMLNYCVWIVQILT